MGTKYSGACCLVIGMVYDKLIGNDAFELEDFGDMKEGVCSKVLFVLVPLLL